MLSENIFNALIIQVGFKESAVLTLDSSEAVDSRSCHRLCFGAVIQDKKTVVIRAPGTQRSAG